MKKLVAFLCVGGLFACPQPVKPTVCEQADAGPQPTVDAGQPAPFDAGTLTLRASDGGRPELGLVRILNLGREPVVLKFDGADAGEALGVRESALRVEPVGSTHQVSVLARTFSSDGGTTPSTILIEMDGVRGDQPTTYVVRDLTPESMEYRFDVQKAPSGTRTERLRTTLGGVQVTGGVDLEGDCMAEVGGTQGAPARVSLRADRTTSCPSSNDTYFGITIEADVDGDGKWDYFVHGPDGLEVATVSEVHTAREAGSGLATGRRLGVSSFSIGEPGVQRTITASGAGMEQTIGIDEPGVHVTASFEQPRMHKPYTHAFVLNVNSTQQPVTVSIEGVVVARDVAAGTLYRVPSNLLAQAAQAVALNGLPPGEPWRRGAVSLNGLPPGQPYRVQIASGAVMQTLQATPDLTGPCRPPYLCDFLMNQPMLVVASDAVSSRVLPTVNKRSISLVSTTATPTRGCISVNDADTTCAMGTAVAVNGVVNDTTDAALFAPKDAPAQGATMRFAVQEGTARLFWDSPAGLTPRPGRSPKGIAVIAPATAVDSMATPDRRALFFVDTTDLPWTVSTALSRLQ